MKPNPPFSYPEGLTQLDDFDMTELEHYVATNPSFQALSRTGFPRLGELATGLHYHDDSGHDRYMPSVTRQLSHGDVKKQAELYGRHLTSVTIMAAKVFRDYSGDARLTGYHDRFVEPDARLIHDLVRWLDCNSKFKGFRWEEHWRMLQERAKIENWKARADQFRADGGDSSLTVLLVGQLSFEQTQQMYKELIAGCKIVRGLPGDYPREQLMPFLPRTFCMKCDWEQLHSDNRYPGPPPHSRAIPLVNCGSVTEVKRLISDRWLRRQIRPVRFTLPHEGFGDSEKFEQMYAELLIFDLEKLSSYSRQKVLRHLTAWVEKEKRAEEAEAESRVQQGYAPRTAWATTKVLRPDGNQQLHAIVVAGRGVWHQVNYHEAFKPHEEWNLINEGMSVTTTFEW